jgi:hypothetical protein
MAFAPITYAQGFSNQKLELYPRTPAKIPLSGVNLTLKFESQAPVGYDQLRDVAKNLEDFLKKQIPQARTPDADKIEIICIVTDLQTSQKDVVMWRSEYQRTGSHTETDHTTGTTRTVDDYGWVNVRRNGIAIDVRISVKYELKDSVTGILIDAETINTGYYQEYETYNVPGINVVQRELLAKAANEIGQRFASRVFEIKAPLSKGKLKDASNLLVKRSWAEAQRLLEATPRFSNNKDEAFRLYLLGIVNEAIAYEATDIAYARKHLDLAAKYHAEARTIKPDQLEFWWSEGRAADLAWMYGNAQAKARALEESRKEVIAGRIAVEEATRRIQIAGDQPSPTTAVGSGFDPLSNAEIIGWIKGGVPEKVIKATIKRAATYSNYDLSTSGIADLRRAGASQDIVKEMKSSQYPGRPDLPFKALFAAMGIMSLALPLLVLR